MTAARALRPDAIRFAVEPRDVPAVKAARRLHLTLADFEKALPKLRARGFPAPDPDTGCFDLKAIDAWMDNRSGLAAGTAASDPVSRMKNRIAGMSNG